MLASIVGRSIAVKRGLAQRLRSRRRTGAYGIAGEADGTLRDTTNNITEPFHFVFSMDGVQFGQPGAGLQNSFEAIFTLTDPHFVGAGSFGGRVVFERN
jgi:hypothetical protein